MLWEWWACWKLCGTGCGPKRFLHPWHSPTSRCLGRMKMFPMGSRLVHSSAGWGLWGVWEWDCGCCEGLHCGHVGSNMWSIGPKCGPNPDGRGLGLVVWGFGRGIGEELGPNSSEEEENPDISLVPPPVGLFVGLPATESSNVGIVVGCDGC